MNPKKPKKRKRKRRPYIQMNKETKLELRELKNTERETFDSIIARLIMFYKQHNPKKRKIKSGKGMVNLLSLGKCDKDES